MVKTISAAQPSLAGYQLWRAGTWVLRRTYPQNTRRQADDPMTRADDRSIFAEYGAGARRTEPAL